jgi:enoyl-CoA hydratase/carnithine racemase
MSSSASLPHVHEAILLRSDDDGITTLTLNRPKQFNSLSGALLSELQAALQSIANDASIRVVIIAGRGAAFCAGHDLKEMRANRSREAVKQLFERCCRMMTTISEIPQPVIARVHGIATAAGCQLVAQCDLAVAATTARFATSGINVGLFCSTPAVAVSRNLSRKQAFEMLFTGDFIDAPTALSQGLVNRVVPIEALASEVEQLARTIAAKPRVAVSAGKRLFYKQLEAGLEQAYALAAEAITCSMMTDEAAEGIAAFMEKRPPRWPTS